MPNAAFHLPCPTLHGATLRRATVHVKRFLRCADHGQKKYLGWSLTGIQPPLPPVDGDAAHPKTLGESRPADSETLPNLLDLSRCHTVTLIRHETPNRQGE
jgi:hypothetical protein